MKITRTKNAKRNIVYGFILKFYQLLLPFLIRTVIVHELGVGYLGLNGLFASILQVLNLTELGVGSALVFSMYQPIVDDDVEKIRAYMRLYRTYYRIIGLIILVIGLAITPLVPKLISGNVPDDINVYVLYLLNLSITVLTYWLFSYRNSLLYAHQRTDVISKIAIGTDTVKYVLQIATLIIFHNYYYYLIVRIIVQVLNNILVAIASMKYFPDYYPEGKLPIDDVKRLDRRIKDLFTSKLAGTIVLSVDTIVISAFLGLEVLGIYQNYYYILSAVMGFIAIIYSSIKAGVGNSLLTKSMKQNEKDFNVFTVLFFWIVSICVSCFLTMFQPFMIIWMGSDMLLEYNFVVLFCAYFVSFEIVKMVSVYKDAGGIWHRDRFRPLISGLINLGLNIILVNYIGLYGILLSTIICEGFISVPWIIHNIYNQLFKMNPGKYYKQLICFIISAFVIGAICYFAVDFIPDGGLLLLAVKGIVAALIANVLFAILFRKNIYYAEAKQMVFQLLGIKQTKIING